VVRSESAGNALEVRRETGRIQQTEDSPQITESKVPQSLIGSPGSKRGMRNGGERAEQRNEGDEVGAESSDARNTRAAEKREKEKGTERR